MDSLQEGVSQTSNHIFPIFILMNPYFQNKYTGASVRLCLHQKPLAQASACALIFLILFFNTPSIHSQTVYYHISNKPVYAFLDEMANLKLIELNSAIKPYSREFIAQKLQGIKSQEEVLNTRQKKDLDFFLKDFNKELKPGKEFNKRLDLFYYKDSLFSVTVNPVLGLQYWTNENGNNYHRWNGAEAYGYIGKHFGFYASLRDNYEDTVISNELFLDTRPGANYKGNLDYSDMRGGVTWSWKWGQVGLVKDHLEWGTNYEYPNIFSSKPPSYAQIKLRINPVRWFEFNYFHGWLVSEVVDSARSYSIYNSYPARYREVYFNKYVAANIFSFQPIKHSFISVGNSIIYSSDNVHPAYLIPFMMFKSVDHTLGGANSNFAGQNSQMFFDISIRSIKYLHIYSTLFLDELSVERFFDKDESNFAGYKYGLQFSNLPANTFFTIEYTKTLPLVYKHHVTTTTFESNGYNLGHYMQDNSREFYMNIIYKPLRGLTCKAYYIFAQHGKDHTELGTPRLGIKYLDSVEWENQTFGLDINYQLINDVYLCALYRHSHITGDVDKYTRRMYHGTTNTLSFGANVGF